MGNEIKEKEIFDLTSFTFVLFEFVTKIAGISLIIKKKLKVLFKEKRLYDMDLYFQCESKKIHQKYTSKLTQEKAFTHWLETKGKEEEEIKYDMNA